MRSLLIIGATAMFMVPVPGAQAAATVDGGSEHHVVETEHDLNICGNPGTFTFDVTWRYHAIENDSNFVFDYHEVAKYTLVFDDPALGTWRGRGTETAHFVSNGAGDMFRDNFSGREGPVQIIEHLLFRDDGNGNLTVEREFDRHVGC